jgi:inorganic pyrophosphatase
MINLWRELEPGPNIPDIIYVIVEIPKGSRNKYEYGKELGVIKLDRVLFSSLHYPGDYGFIPRTLYDDGDPLDVLVMVNEPTFPGSIFDDYQDTKDIPQHFLKEVAHFFEVYKDLEGKRAKPLGWEPVLTAKTEIRRSIELYREKYSRGMRI